MQSNTLNQRGFTLIELMVTVTVMAILLAIAVPTFIDVRERNVTRGAAEQLLSAFAAARFEAVKRDRFVKVGFLRNGSGQMCVGTEVATAADDDTICSCFTAGACGITQYPTDQGEWGGARWLADPTMGGGSGVVVIDPKLGLLSETGDAGSVIVRSANDAYDYRLQVEFSMLGRASVCIPSGARPIPGYRSC